MCADLLYKNCGKTFYFQIKSQKVFSGENFSKDFLKDSDHFFADKTKFSKEKNLSMVQYLESMKIIFWEKMVTVLNSYFYDKPFLPLKLT